VFLDGRESYLFCYGHCPASCTEYATLRLDDLFL
jgi:hypothetical protein